MILSAELYESETRSVTLWKGNRLMVFESSV